MVGPHSIIDAPKITVTIHLKSVMCLSYPSSTTPLALMLSHIELLLLLICMSPSTTTSTLLRLNEGAMSGLAELTRSWMRSHVDNMRIDPYIHRIHHKLATGQFELLNISIDKFHPPAIQYKPTEGCLLYMSTDGGEAEINAKWRLYSHFLDTLGLPLQGDFHGRIIGFASDVAIQISPSSKLNIHQCVARFVLFEIELSGSLAADLLHWFHQTLAKAMQSRLEQTYCQMLEDQLVPWLRLQLERLPLQFGSSSVGRRFGLTHSLQSIGSGAGFLDLKLRNTLTIEMDPGGKNIVVEELENGRKRACGVKKRKQPSAPSPSHPSDVELLLDEPALQRLLSAIHHSGHLRTNFTSPLLRTHCEFFCLGKLLPQSMIIGRSQQQQLYGELRSSEAPRIKLVDRHLRLSLNVTLEVFQAPTPTPVVVAHTQTKTKSVVGRIQPLVDPNGHVIWPTSKEMERLVVDPHGGVKWTTPHATIAATATTTPVSSTKQRLPVLRIELSAEVELTLRMVGHRLETDVHFLDSKALLQDSILKERLNQKSINHLVDASVPFLERSIKILLHDGILLTQQQHEEHTAGGGAHDEEENISTENGLSEVLFMRTLPAGTRDGSLRVEDGQIRIGAEIDMEELMQIDDD